jgi:hypothetical protein
MIRMMITKLQKMTSIATTAMAVMEKKKVEKMRTIRKKEITIKVKRQVKAIIKHLQMPNLSRKRLLLLNKPLSKGLSNTIRYQDRVSCEKLRVFLIKENREFTND